MSSTVLPRGYKEATIFFLVITTLMWHVEDKFQYQPEHVARQPRVNTTFQCHVKHDTLTWPMSVFDGASDSFLNLGLIQWNRTWMKTHTFVLERDQKSGSQFLPYHNNNHFWMFVSSSRPPPLITLSACAGIWQMVWPKHRKMREGVVEAFGCWVEGGMLIFISSPWVVHTQSEEDFFLGGGGRRGGASEEERSGMHVKYCACIQGV